MASSTDLKKVPSTSPSANLKKVPSANVDLKKVPSAAPSAKSAKSVKSAKSAASNVSGVSPSPSKTVLPVPSGTPVAAVSSGTVAVKMPAAPVPSNPGLITDESVKKKALTLDAISKLSATLPADKRTHLAATGKQLLNAWRNNKFCDVVIKAEHSLFYAHLEVFVAFTDYFEDVPAQRKVQQINLGLDVKPDDCAAVLKYLYFGELQASAENVYGIWTISKALHIHDIDVACATFIERLLTPPNLVYVLEYCEQKKVQDLHAAAYDRFMVTFYEQTENSLFLEWDVDKVIRLLGCDDLKVKTELDVYVAMKRWIDHKRPERIAYLEVLIELVRFAHMTRDELVQCTLLDPSYLEVLKVKELLATANWYITMQQSGRHWSEFQLPKPRHPPRKD
ncbi:kelch-like protein 12 [Paramacrobiotus metropolitanus]|uniref:kelch-like protein 12 n=1 Tax=Paramacrobiotus metropolitanus TaxID=2943436 RepID=UPI0024461A60|nr:kelch-like protein 12 [Paramacrobiotus metropolitanus]